MKDYLQIANGGIFYLCGVVITILVLLQAFFFIRISFKEGKKLGLSKEKMFKALRIGVITSIIPTIPAIIALIAMVPILGLPIPWIRQTIMGSTTYELVAAGIGAKAMSVSYGGPDFKGPAFASTIWIMTLGSIWAVLIVVFFLRRFQSKISPASGGDPVWRNILINAAFFGVFSIFIADPIVAGGVPLVTLIAGAILMAILAVLVVKLKINWLREFALTISMVGAMICAVLATNILL